MKQLTKLMEEMKQGVYRDTLKDIYIDESVIAHQEERYVKAMAEYQKLYGDREVEVYSAPGRSEVGGNHTDHQHGMVLATSINLDAIAIVNKNEDMTVRCFGLCISSVIMRELQHRSHPFAKEDLRISLI